MPGSGRAGAGGCSQALLDHVEQVDDLRGSALRGANVLIPFHEVYAVSARDRQPAGLPQLSYIAFVSPARNLATGAPGHVHWFTYTEDPAGVPGKYGDGKLAHITRSQAFTKEGRGETQVRVALSAVADGGAVRLSLAYKQGGMVVWATAEEPNLPLYAAEDPRVVRWYQEDQVMDVVRSDPAEPRRRLRGQPRRAGRAGGRVRRQRARGVRVHPAALYATGVRSLDAEPAELAPRPSG